MLPTAAINIERAALIFVSIIFVLVLRYNKTNCDWHHQSSRQHFTFLWQKIFNDDLNASHYLYSIEARQFLNE